MIQKNQSEHPVLPTSDRQLKRCSAFCTASSYRLLDLMHHLREEGLNPYHFRSGNVVHHTYGKESGDVFYFAYGTIVSWGLSKEEELEILQRVKPCEDDPNESLESEESRYWIGDSAKILKDDISLPSDSVLTKVAFSHGLAQSVKLSIFERLVQRRIENSRTAPESLAKHGHIPMSRTKLAKMMGEIVLDRNSINLHTDILDTPEFFWEHSDLEPLYRLISQDLDIIARVNVLNRRLDILRELFEILSNELDNRYSSNLEWIIIVLIFIEVAVTFAKDIFHIL
jgi:uncharacterized Rmd1/YagE family protein